MTVFSTLLVDLNAQSAVLNDCILHVLMRNVLGLCSALRQHCSLCQCLANLSEAMDQEKGLFYTSCLVKELRRGAQDRRSLL